MSLRERIAPNAPSFGPAAFGSVAEFYKGLDNRWLVSDGARRAPRPGRAQEADAKRDTY